MLEKKISIDGYSFVLNYLDKNLINNAKEGKVLAFGISYVPKSFEYEWQTNQILQLYKNYFLTVIYAIINDNVKLYERFELLKNFDCCWSGGYNKTGQLGTVYTYQHCIMKLVTSSNRDIDNVVD